MNQIASFLIHHPETLMLMIVGAPVFLTRLGSRAFGAIFSGQGQTVTYSQIHRAMYGDANAGDEVARVKQTIKRVRRELDERHPGLGHELIVNHSGAGYRLNEEALKPLLRH